MKPISFRINATLSAAFATGVIISMLTFLVLPALNSPFAFAGELKECEDGIDNDNDGAIDLLDDDCNDNPKGPSEGEKKITICHADGQVGTLKYQKLTLAESAVYSNGNGGHLNEGGTPQTGHENDVVLKGPNETCPSDQVPGTLIVEKKVVDAQGTPVPSPDFSIFEIKVDGNVVALDATAGTYTNATALQGAHTVAETQEPGYEAPQYSDSCANGSINVVAGQSVTCTITNKLSGGTGSSTGTLIVEKKVVDAQGTPVPSPDFSIFEIKVDGNVVALDATAGTYTNATALQGAHTVAETQEPGYEAPQYSDSCANGSINVVAGQSVTCTITNTYALPPPPCGTELVVNGSFESPIVEDGAGWDIFSSGLDWIVDWVSNDEPAPLELHRGVNGRNSSAGSQYAELDSDTEGPGGSTNGEPALVTISQDIATQVGKTYILSYDFSPRPQTTDADNVLKVSVDGVLVQTQTSGNETNQTDWATYTYEFVATDTLTTIAFEDAGTPNSMGTFLDNVSLEEKCSDVDPDPGNAHIDVCKVVVGGPHQASYFSFTVNGGEPEQFGSLNEQDDACRGYEGEGSPSGFFGLSLPADETYTIAEVKPVDYAVTYQGSCSEVEFKTDGDYTCFIINTYDNGGSQDIVDLELTKEVDDNTVVENQTITYTVKVKNVGNVSVDGVFVTDALPVELDYQSSTATHGSYNENSDIWTVGTLNAGETAQLDMEVRVLVDSGTITNEALADIDPEFEVSEPNKENNHAKVDIVAQRRRGGGGGSSSRYTPTPEPTPVQEVLGASTTTLPETGAGDVERAMLSLFAGMFSSGLVLMGSGIRKYRGAGTRI